MLPAFQRKNLKTSSTSAFSVIIHHWAAGTRREKKNKRTNSPNFLPFSEGTCLPSCSRELGLSFRLVGDLGEGTGVMDGILRTSYSLPWNFCTLPHLPSMFLFLTFLTIFGFKNFLPFALFTFSCSLPVSSVCVCPGLQGFQILYQDHPIHQN